MKNRCVLRNKIIFIIFIVIAAYPLMILPIISTNYQEHKGLPRIQKGVLDLEGVDFKTNKQIPLNGEWEFYPNQWIITNGKDSRDWPQTIQIPTSWNTGARGADFKVTFGFGTYRLRLINCPTDVELMTFIPNIRAAYRVYMDGNLIASSGTLSKEPNKVELNQNVLKNRLTLPRERNVDISIEVSAKYFPVINYTPLLVESGSDYTRTNLRFTWASMYIGAFITFIILYSLVLISGGRNLYSIYLMLVCIILSLIISNRGEIGATVGLIIPYINSSAYIDSIALVSSFLPLLMYLYVHDLLESKVSVEMFGMLLILTGIGIMGRVTPNIGDLNHYKVLFIAAGFVPALLSIPFLFREISKNTSYALALGISYLFILSGILVEQYSFLGIYIFNMSMFLPTCFAAFFVILLYVYVKKNTHSQRIAKESQKSELELSQMKLKMKESESALMLSQIRPHFLYNALIAIYELNNENSAEASEAILKFARYLRVNMRSIGSKEPITFQEELKHIQNYVAIEKLRFGKRLNVCYDIEADCFLVPPLTIQPLVENAIKHGVCKRIEGGTIVIKTYETEEAFIIEVSDNGVGFDVDILNQKNMDSMGIKNIKARLAIVMNASVNLSSEKDIGTMARVEILKEYREKGMDYEDGSSR
ncbi:MAG: hypothetical protein K0S71_1713 [Clostridia bacterium]|jgi:sensor histidine kinase YesM|nr:hypothetical protein [Clostridia bacterium]